MANRKETNQSEAIRVALNRGLRELGHLDGMPRIVYALRVAAMLLLLQCAGTIVAFGVLNQAIFQTLTMWFAGGSLLTFICSKYFEMSSRYGFGQEAGEA